VHKQRFPRAVAQAQHLHKQRGMWKNVHLQRFPRAVAQAQQPAQAKRNVKKCAPTKVPTRSGIDSATAHTEEKCEKKCSKYTSHTWMRKFCTHGENRVSNAGMFLSFVSVGTCIFE